MKFEGHQITAVGEEPIEKALNYDRLMINISTEEAVDALISHRKELKLAADSLGDDKLINRMSSPKFKEKNPDEYKKVVETARSQTAQYDQLANEMCPSIEPKFKSGLLKYLDTLGVECEFEDIAKRLDGVLIHFMDAIRYFGLIAEDSFPGITSDPLGSYISTANGIIINLSKISRTLDYYKGGLKSEEESTHLFHEIINHTLRHELVHAASYQNFWNSEYAPKLIALSFPRRVGLKNIPERDVQSRLSLLNEAVTEKISRDTSSPYHEENTEDVQRRLDHHYGTLYSKEREILDALCYLVDWEYLVAAYFNKKDFLSLNRELSEKAGLTLSDIDASMKMDKEDEYQHGYTITLLKKRMGLFSKITYAFKHR